jgi:hypothetical protein
MNTSEMRRTSSGKAFFEANALNVYEGKPTKKHFISGHYTIQDIYCMSSFVNVRWKYKAW